jgi:hypothetical protein
MRGPLLVVTFLAACSSERDEGAEPPPRDPPPEEPTKSTPTKAAPAASFEGVAAHLPHPEVRGWRAGAPRTFDSGSLYTYMDGGSDAYIEYGFERMAVADYHPASGGASKTVQIEVYDMGMPASAFGRFSRLAVEGGDPAELAQRWVDVGAGGIASGTDLAFWKGQLMVKLTYLDESPDATEESLRSAAREVLLPIAREMVGALPGEVTPLPDVERLPDAGLMPHSEIRYGRAALGLEELAGTIAAEYDVSGKRMRLYVARFETAELATAAYDKVRARFQGAGQPLAELGDAAQRGHDPDRGEIFLARKGPTLAILTNSDTPGVTAADPAQKTALLRRAIEGHDPTP